jgi:hypothetical protein
MLYKLLKFSEKHHRMRLWAKLISLFIERFNTSPFNLLIGYLPDYFFEGKVCTDSCRSVDDEFVYLKNVFTKRSHLNNNGDLNRLISLILNLRQIADDNVAGDFAELGVYKGNTAAVLSHFARKQGRKVFLFDTFSGFNAKDLVGIDSDQGEHDFTTSLNLVKSVVGDMSNVEIVQGWFPESIQSDHLKISYAAVSLDCDLYEPMKAGLKYFWPRLATGGIIFIHDYSSGLWPGVRQAVDEYFEDVPVFLTLLPDKSGSAVVRKSSLKEFAS